MEALGSVSSIIAVIQIAGSIAKLCGGYVSDVKDAHQDIERLQQKGATLRDVLQKLIEASDVTNRKPLNLSNEVMISIKQCSDDLARLQKKLQPKTGHKAMSKVGLRALKWPLSKSSVNDDVRMIEGYLAVFNAALQLGHMAISLSIDHKIDQGRDDQLLKSISHIGDAAYDSWENQRHRPCLTDTRVDLLQEITDWATCNTPQYIFWLQGRAGTGKSTIALTMAHTLDRQGAILASFFFKRGGGDLARSRMVISTIVYQLAMRSRLFGGFVCDALREHPNLGDSASLSQQYDKLFFRSLQQYRQSALQLPPFIVVLDALDECDDPNDVRLLLRLLGNTQSLAGLGFRVLATSRPETPIRLGFRGMKHITYHEVALHDVPRALVDHDIQRFVTHKLLQIRTERVLPESWPGEDKIRIITSRVDGLFIYAATVCRYVNSPRQVSSIVRLEQVCQGSATKHKSTDTLDKMYLMVLDSSMRDDFSAQEAQEVTLRLRQVMGSVILLLDNLSAEELARLVFPSLSAGGVLVQDTLDSLHAIFDVPEDLNSSAERKGQEPLSLLVDYIKKTYSTISNRLSALLKNGEITYDLLWALFKPHTSVFTTCPGSEQPRCVEYVSGEERKTTHGRTYFHMECHYLDFDGRIFGQAMTQIGIAKFRGVTRIDLLEAFPLEYHPSKTEITTHLVACGRKFVSLIGKHHHRHYQGVAFIMQKGQAIRIPVHSRIMIDPEMFRELHPSYTRPKTYEPRQESSIGILFGEGSGKPADQVKDNEMDPSEVRDEDLLHCSPTIPGWIFSDKTWAEFAIHLIQDITWNPTAFQNLEIPSKKKKVVQALAETCMVQSSDTAFDDFIAGKGRGIIVLLHGPPGVGKTLTAEALSEHLHRPLYSVTAGELGHDAEAVEAQLSFIFRLTSHWKALVLLDEADVFVQKRSLNHTMNGQVSVFLRKLEYYRGVMFLTTNRVRDIDDAIQSRITIALKYDALSYTTRRIVWERFLKKATTVSGPAVYKPNDLNELAHKNLNGRQIKNNVAAAYALAIQAMERVSMTHLSEAVTANEEFEDDFHGAGSIANLGSYT